MMKEQVVRIMRPVGASQSWGPNNVARFQQYVMAEIGACGKKTTVAFAHHWVWCRVSQQSLERPTRLPRLTNGELS